jgi:hypothetical protein
MLDSVQTEKGKQVKSKVKSMLMILFDIKGLLAKNSSWQAKQSIPHTTVTLYGECVKICKDFAPNFGNKRTGCCLMTMQHLALPFSPGNFLP